MYHRYGIVPVLYLRSCDDFLWTLGKFTLKLKTVQCDTFENNYVFQTM